MARYLSALTLALLVVGCGSSSSSTSPSSASSASSSAPTVSRTSNTPYPPGSPEDRYASGLVQDKNFTQAQADCTVKAVLKKIGKARFDKLYGANNVPADVQSTISSAAAKCAPRGPGQ